MPRRWTCGLFRLGKLMAIKCPAAPQQLGRFRQVDGRARLVRGYVACFQVKKASFRIVCLQYLFGGARRGSVGLAFRISVNMGHLWFTIFLFPATMGGFISSIGARFASSVGKPSCRRNNNGSPTQPSPFWICVNLLVNCCHSHQAVIYGYRQLKLPSSAPKCE